MTDAVAALEAAAASATSPEEEPDLESCLGMNGADRGIENGAGAGAGSGTCWSLPAVGKVVVPPSSRGPKPAAGSGAMACWLGIWWWCMVRPVFTSQFRSIPAVPVPAPVFVFVLVHMSHAPPPGTMLLTCAGTSSSSTSIEVAVVNIPPPRGPAAESLSVSGSGPAAVQSIGTADDRSMFMSCRPD